MAGHDPLDGLWKRMEDDMAFHRALLEDMKREWECLKRNDPSSLLSLLQSKEVHLAAIKTNRESMIRILEGFRTDGTGRNLPSALTDLLPLVSPPQTRKIRDYRGAIRRLLQQILSLNEQNKRFVQETLTYLEGVFSLLTVSRREEGITYAQWGKTVSAGLPPRWMSREV